LLHCGGGSFKSQMKKADNSGAVCAVIVGDDEAAANAVTLKPLRGGEQERVALTELQSKIKELIK
jgi:histidyl-tRNA synthetase